MWLLIADSLVGGRGNLERVPSEIDYCPAMPSEEGCLIEKHPLYGCVAFDGTPLDRSSGIRFHFVLDESGEASKPNMERWTMKASGDALALMYVEYGPLRITLSNNLHAEGQPFGADRYGTFAVRIRKDKPFVLDFSNQPEVVFARPVRGHTLKPGDQVRVDAVLIDSALNIMVRGLDDTSPTKETDKVSLDPIVTVTDSSGKKVAEGKRPFG